MTTSDYARAVLRYWWVLLLFVLVGVGGGYLRNTLATNVYASHVTFYISTPSDGISAAYSSDQYAQSRANSYALLIASQRAAEAVIASSGLAMTTGQVMGEIHASVPLNTVLLTATVDDTSAARALSITTGLAKTFGPLVDQLDNSGKVPTVELSVVSGPSGSSKPIAPRVTVNLVLGFLAGLVLGLVCAVALFVRRRARLARRAGTRTMGQAPANAPHEPSAPVAVSTQKPSLVSRWTTAPGHPRRAPRSEGRARSR